MLKLFNVGFDNNAVRQAQAAYPFSALVLSKIISQSLSVVFHNAVSKQKMTNCQLKERLLLSLLVLGLHFNYPASLHISDSRHRPALTPWPVIKVTFIHHCDEFWPCSSCNSLLSCFIIAGLLQSVGGRTQGAVGLGQGARLEVWVSQCSKGL